MLWLQPAPLGLASCGVRTPQRAAAVAIAGGKATTEEQRRLGADLEVDVPYQYLTFFLEDDQELANIGETHACCMHACIGCMQGA